MLWILAVPILHICLAFPSLLKLLFFFFFLKFYFTNHTGAAEHKHCQSRCCVQLASTDLHFSCSQSHWRALQQSKDCIRKLKVWEVEPEHSIPRPPSLCLKDPIPRPPSLYPKDPHVPQACIQRTLF